ncbi:hypothetical protein QBC39DRAFT_269218 [Podospora conica]|nr:hypothetical protein QBC39DRAFT_269218 [Schizothecium conicum]
MSNPAPIAVLSLRVSQNRAVVRKVHEAIQPYGYNISGILESDPFSKSDLALALRILEPPPAAVVVGRGYSDDEAAETRQVFAQFQKEVGIEKGTVIKITDEVFDRVGKEGVPKWVLEQLEAFFEK